MRENKLFTRENKLFIRENKLFMGGGRGDKLISIEWN